MAHGYLVAEAAAGSRNVGGACRGADRCDVRRPAADHGPCRGRGGAGVRGARRGRLGRRRSRPHRRVLLAGQAAGCGILHHGAVRADAFRACRLDRCRRRTGPMGRALRAFRSEAVHGRQYRRVHGRLVPARDQRRRRREGHEDPFARTWRRNLSPARRDPADHVAGRDPHRHAIRPDRRRGIRRSRLRHRAGALSRRDLLLRARFQQAERHRRMHRLAQGLGEPRFGNESDRAARLCVRGPIRARRDGAPQCRGAGGLDRAARRQAAHVSAGSDCRGAPTGR